MPGRQVNTELKTRKVTFISHHNAAKLSKQALYQCIDVYMESFGQQKSYVNHISRYINLKYTSAHTFKEGDPLRNEAATYQGFCCIGVLTEMIVHPPSASDLP